MHAYECVLPLYRRALAVAGMQCPRRATAAVALHIRRGDVTNASGHRWIPTSTYFRVLKQLHHKQPLHLHSQGTLAEFPFCTPPACILKLNIDVLDMVRDCICAKHFIGTAQSLLSISIALLRTRNSTLIFRHRALLRSPPERWSLLFSNASERTIQSLPWGIAGPEKVRLKAHVS